MIADRSGGASATASRMHRSCCRRISKALFKGGALADQSALRAAVDARLPVRTRLAINARRMEVSPPASGRHDPPRPATGERYVFLMGHLDHLGLKPDAKPGEDAIYNGALDNAAGIATMLEAARHFVEAGKRPRRSVIFMANTGEEKGLLGASYYIAHPTVPARQIIAAVDLDMPLLTYDFTDIVAFGADHSTVARTVAQAARQASRSP